MKAIKLKSLFLSLVSSSLLLVFSYNVQAKTDTVILAGGCFWCVEHDFAKIAGVLTVESGYTGGTVANPSYEQVSSKKTNHFEAVKISFDDSQVSLKALTDFYWRSIDPTDAAGQFCDKGTPYKTALFYQSEAQKQVFEQSLAEVNKSKPFSADIVTEILPAKPFYLAEDYHQDYAARNPLRYKYYRSSCGRDSRLQSLWGEEALKFKN